MDESKTMTLPAGRTLGHAEYGPDGKPVFYFHGFPGSRLEGRILDNVAKENRSTDRSARPTGTSRV